MISVYNYSSEIDLNINIRLAEKIEEIKLIKVISQINADINIFNYNYDNTNVNIELVEKIQLFDEMKLLLNNTDTNTMMNLKTYDKKIKSFLSVVTKTKSNNNSIDVIDDEYINKPYTKTEITSILNILQLTNVTIENVYQEKYGPDINASGLGDFIRGSYFLMQFCEENQLLFNINMLNHPISRFLEFYQNKQPLDYKNINKFDLTNFNPSILDDNILINMYDCTINNDFIYFLKDKAVHNKKIYTYLITYPTIIIAEEHKIYMRHILKPTKYLSLLVDEQLTKLESISE